VLHGTEVKALREGKANIRDAYVDFKPSGPYLVNAHIAQYMPGGPWNHEPLGNRKLLLHKREIYKLSGRTESKGLTVIPCGFISATALPRSKSRWRRAKSRGTAARTNVTRMPAGKRSKRCIATGGDKRTMQITLQTKPIVTLAEDALVTYLFEESVPIQNRIADLDKLTGGLLGRLAKSGELTGKTLELTLVHAPAGLKSARLLLVGAGKRELFNPATLRKVAGAALRYLKTRGVHKFVFALREGDLTEEAAQAVTEGPLPRF